MTDVTTSSRRPVWLTPPVLTVAVLAVAAGLAQFSVTAVIGDVAAAFGEPGASEDELAAQIGLPASTLGIALAAIRLASLASLPAAAMADRFGRRRLLLMLTAAGLAATSLAAAAPAFWFYVALVALARPMLSTVSSVAGVIAAEEASARDRSAAIALITAAYGVGAGIVSVTRGLLDEPSFRLVTAFALVPLVLLPLLAPRVREPRIASNLRPAVGLPGKIPAPLRRRVTVLATLTGAIALATGPAFSYLFVYSESVLGASSLFTSLLVLGAGPAGLAGILLGRLGSDRIGRRATAGTMMAITGAGGALAYTGGTAQLAVGYLLAIAASSGFAPPAGALAAELVPTTVRATVAGWITFAGVLGAVVGLASFGVLASLTGGFATASQVIAATVAMIAAGFALLPETRGTELDDPAPGH